MPSYMIFRAVTPPGFNMEEYSKRSSEPIRYDAVTVVDAEDAREAVDTLIASTGTVAAGFAVVEVDMITFGSKSKLGEGGKLLAASARDKANQETDAKLKQIESDLDTLRKM